MQGREKRLTLILGGAVAVWLVLPVFEGWFLQPVTERRGLLEVARSQFTQREDRQFELHKAQARLRDWEYESLPPNQLTAQREYQEWLMDMAVMSGFTNPVPTLGRRMPRGTTYVQIPVTIEAQATLSQLARFLYHCERVSLLHRIDSMDILSPQSDGNPLLDVSLTAMGLALPDAEQRQHLFPRTTLTADLSEDGTVIAIEPVERFPQVTGFQIKLGHELATVRLLDAQTWTIDRGAEQTIPVAHPAGTAVELFPVDRDRTTRSFDEYASLLEHGPFTKPAPEIDYVPVFSPLSDPVVMRGTQWEATLSVTGWDPSGGVPVYALGDDAPPGMEVDAETGRLSWAPTDNVAAQEYDVPVRAESHVKPLQQVTATLTVTLRDPNLPPEFGDIESAAAYSGRPLTISVTATDPDGSSEDLVYALTGEVPEGAAINARTGELSWTPPLTLDLGDYPLSVTVTDGGAPPQSVEHVVTIVVEEDAALFTYYVGYFNEDGQPEAFLYNRATNERMMARPGEQIVIADIDAQVAKIEREHIELTIGDRTLRLPLGKNLRQLLPVAETTSPTSSDAN